VRQETVVQRLMALGQFHERTRNLIREGGQNTARFARESARLSQELVEAVEAMSNLLDRYVDAIHTVMRQREDLKIESHDAQLLAQTLAAQFEGARGIARVKGRDVEALTLVVQHAQREIDTLVRENTELRVSLELEKSATQTVAEDWDEVRPTSPNASTGSTGLNLVVGLAASLLVLRTLFKKFKRNKRTP
jgi:hypothetical protein